MDVVCPHLVVQQVFRQLLRHTFCQRCHQHSLVFLASQLDFFKQIVDLVLARSNHNLRVKQSRGADNLFHHNAFRLLKLIVGWGCRHVNHLIYQLLKLIEPQRAVVERSRKPEAIFHEVALAGPVAAVHGRNLRHTDVALVDDHQEILWKEVEKTVWPFACLSAVEVAAVVLYSRTMSQFAYHLDVILHAFLYALGSDAVAQFLEVVNLHHQVVLNEADSLFGLLL